MVVSGGGEDVRGGQMSGRVTWRQSSVVTSHCCTKNSGPTVHFHTLHNKTSFHRQIQLSLCWGPPIPCPFPMLPFHWGQFSLTLSISLLLHHYLAMAILFPYSVLVCAFLSPPPSSPIPFCGYLKFLSGKCISFPSGWGPGDARLPKYLLS